MSTLEDAGPSIGSTEPRWKLYACLALLLIGLHLSIGNKVRISQWQVRPDNNSALEEALRWKEGALDIQNNDYESARVGDKRYNVFGLAFVLISLLGTSLTKWTGGGSADFDAAYFRLLIALPLVLAAYGAFRAQTRSSVWGAVLAGYLIAGTSLVPVLVLSGGGSVHSICHVVAIVGLLIFAADLLGPRRIWPAAIGLALAAWSRQMTALYALPLLWLAWPRQTEGPRGKRPLWIATLAVAVIAALPMTLSALKYGNPFESGYRYIYEGRTDPIGRAGQEKLFGLRYVPDHLRAMNVAFPTWDIRKGTLYPDMSMEEGGSIWLTSPLLVGVLLTFPRWWREPTRRILMLGTLPVIAGLATYHTTGAVSWGCYRYSLDYIPIWLLVIAPYVTTPRAMPWTVGCLAYSALYFNLLP